MHLKGESMNVGKKNVVLLATVITVLFITGTLLADTGRYEQTLSGPGWKLWLDHNAVWANDDVYMPPVDISSLPVNSPTCGWSNLDSVTDKVIDVSGCLICEPVHFTKFLLLCQ